MSGPVSKRPQGILARRGPRRQRPSSTARAGDPAAVAWRSFRWWAHPALGGALLAVALFLPSLRYGFVRDDHWLIEFNPPLLSAGSFGRMMTADFWASAGHASGLWRPVILASYWLDVRIGHGGPAAFHFMNALGHGAATALLGLLLVGAGLSTAGAWAGTLWFAAMPAHVESVAWISGRTDVYCAVFSLLALGLDRRARRRGRRSPGAPPVISLALALLAKEAAVTMIGVLAVAEWIGGGGGRRAAPGPAARSSLRWLAPYGAVTAAYLIAHVVIARAPVAVSGVTAAARAGGRLAGAALLPHQLAFLWPWAGHAPERTISLSASPLAPPVVAGALLSLAFAAGLVRLIRRRAPLALPLALLWLPLLPPIAATLLHGHPFSAERILYLPSAGAAWMLGLLLSATGASAPPGCTHHRLPGRAAQALAAVLIAGSAWQTVRTLPQWRDDQAMYRAMIRVEPRNPVGHVGLAEVFVTAGREAEARAELDRAESLDPRLPEVFVSRAGLAHRHADWPGVVAAAERALALDSMGIEAGLLRANALLRMRRLDQVSAALDRMEAVLPGHPGIESLRGQLLLLQGQSAAALPLLEHAALWSSDDPAVFYALGNARLLEGRPREAAGAFERTVALDPAFYDGWLRLALARHGLGDASGRDAALARAASLPEAGDGRVAALRRQWAGPAAPESPR